MSIDTQRDVLTPPLVEGESLDQAEFHRRYSAMPDHFRAELIDGRVVFVSPVHGPHSDLHTYVILWLGTYMASTPGVRARTDPTTILGPDSEPQPDAVLFIEPSCGGRVSFDEDGCTVGAPELVVEVSYSTEEFDLGPKLADYQSAGVDEYVVVLARSSAVRWFVRQGDHFEEVLGETGCFRSVVFPGLWLDAAAMLREDGPALLETLRQGMSELVHETFCRKLQSFRTS